MADYIKVHYSEYLKNHPKASIRDKIVYFSTLQLHLSAEQGWEFVTIVFTAFFEETLNPSNNLRDWEMLDTLRNLMVQANDANILINQDPQASFRQLYTSVRGMMATWAYSRGQFDIVQEGQAYLLNIINALISLRWTCSLNRFIIDRSNHLCNFSGINNRLFYICAKTYCGHERRCHLILTRS